MKLQEGTRIVVRVAVPTARGVLPAGSVAEIRSVPADPDTTRPAPGYRVRFLNGHEASVQRDEFALLSEVKGHTAAERPDALTEDALRERIVYSCVIGSRAYGLEVEGSDTDRRGIYLAPTDLVLSLYDPPQQLVDDDAQECYWELKKFLVLALKANPNVLEVLYSPLVEIVTPAAEELLAMREAFLSKLVYQTWNGYVLSQFKKMRRSQVVKREPNWKHAMHLIRLLEGGIRILEDGALPLRTEHRDALLEIRAGLWPWPRVDAWRLELHARFEAAYTSTHLPDRPDYAAANRYLLRTRKRELGDAS